MNISLANDLVSSDPLDDPLLNLILDAINEPKEAKYSLEEIANCLPLVPTPLTINPLELVPVLISSTPDPAVGPILDFVGREGNSRELLLAAQEALERWKHALDHEEDQEDAAMVKRLLLLLRLYIAAIGRWAKRKQSVLELLQSVIRDLGPSIDSAAPLATQSQGRQLITSISQLIQAFKPLSESGSNDDRIVMVDLLMTALCSTLAHCSNHINAALAQRHFEQAQPERVFRSAVDNDWEGGENAVDLALTTADIYSSDLPKLLQLSKSSDPFVSFGALILIAHRNPSTLSTLSLLSTLPQILAAFRANIATDESLFLLHNALSSPSTLLDESTAPLLLEVLVPLSSIHPSPIFRNLSFVNLQLLLSKSPPPLRVQLLVNLVSPECDFDAMRVAAIGLAKDTLIETLAPPPANGIHPRILLSAIAPHVLALHGGFPSSATVFFDSESYEPARITQCLGLYCVILARDKSNLSGIRSFSHKKGVETSFLQPLKSALARWSGAGITETDPVLEMSLGGLQLALERVEGISDSIVWQS